jgi:pimeloyl-ACP methyl ester carboxylesterase
MNDHHPCDHPCALACPDVCALHAPSLLPIVLREALDRFRREAVPGTCDTGRYRLPYFTWGSGPPLLFIHGVDDLGRCFIPVISRLSGSFRCIAYDLPGLPGDGARLGRYRHPDLVEDVWALLDHVGARQSYVLASSFGTTVALAALRERPECLPRAILQGGLAYRPLKALERVLARLGSWLPGTVGRLPLRLKVAERVNGFAFRDRERERWEYYLECTGTPPIATFARQALLLGGLDLRPFLAEVRQPVLLVCGDRDAVTGPRHQKVLQEGLPNAGGVIIENCGHVPAYTHPEVLAEVVRQFLTPPKVTR